MTSTRIALFPVFVDPPSSSTVLRSGAPSAGAFTARTGRPILSCKSVGASPASPSASLSSACAALTLSADTTTSTKSSMTALSRSSSRPSLSASSSSSLPSSSKSRTSLAIFCDDQESLKENVPLPSSAHNGGSVVGEKKRKGLRELGVSHGDDSGRMTRSGAGGAKKRREVMRDVSAEYEECRVVDEPEGFRTVCPQSSLTPFEIYVDHTPASIPPVSSSLPRTHKALSSKTNHQSIPPSSFIATPASKKPVKKAFSVYTSPAPLVAKKLAAAVGTENVKPKEKVIRSFGLGGQGAARGLRG